MPDYSIKKMYEFYLQKINLSEDAMHPIQREQTKQAFYAGVSCLLIMQRDDFPNLSDSECFDTLDNMLKECGELWAEVIRKN